MENQAEKKPGNGMETGGIKGFKELKLSYYNMRSPLFTANPYYGNPEPYIPSYTLNVYIYIYTYPFW